MCSKPKCVHFSRCWLRGYYLGLQLYLLQCQGRAQATMWPWTSLELVSLLAEAQQCHISSPPSVGHRGSPPVPIAKSLDRSLCDSRSGEPQVSETAASSHLQGSVGFLCSAQQAAHPREGAESTAAIPSMTAGPAMRRRHSEGWAPVFPRIPPPAKCPPNPSFGDAHQYTTIA